LREEEEEEEEEEEFLILSTIHSFLSVWIHTLKINNNFSLFK